MAEEEEEEEEEEEALDDADKDDGVIDRDAIKLRANKILARAQAQAQREWGQGLLRLQQAPWAAPATAAPALQAALQHCSAETAAL